MIERIALGDRYCEPITLQELCDRFLAQHPASAQTVTYARRRLVRPLAVLGDAQAGDVSTEALQRVVTAVSGKSYRRDITRTLRMVYRWGVDMGLVDSNPAGKVKAPKPIRGENIIPFESWDAVEAVAEECGRGWGEMVVFMADTGLGRLRRSRSSIATSTAPLSGSQATRRRVHGGRST